VGEFANVRSGPGLGYDIVGKLNANQSVTVKGKNTDASWWQVNMPGAPNGVGWVFKDVVTFSGDASKLAVAAAPPLPTAAPQAAAPAAPAAPVAVIEFTPAAPAQAAAPTVAPAAVLPYKQSDLFFEPRNGLDWDALKPNEQTTAKARIEGATSAQIEVVGANPPDIYDCPAGNSGSVSVQGRQSVNLPDVSFPFSIGAKGYYVVTIYVQKADGSGTTIPRGIVVDCYKKPGR
jgi:hypothetical protein